MRKLPSSSLTHGQNVKISKMGIRGPSSWPVFKKAGTDAHSLSIRSERERPRMKVIELGIFTILTKKTKQYEQNKRSLCGLFILFCILINFVCDATRARTRSGKGKCFSGLPRGCWGWKTRTIVSKGKDQLLRRKKGGVPGSQII